MGVGGVCKCVSLESFVISRYFIFCGFPSKNKVRTGLEMHKNILISKILLLLIRHSENKNVA